MDPVVKAAKLQLRAETIRCLTEAQNQFKAGEQSSALRVIELSDALYEFDEAYPHIAAEARAAERAAGQPPQLFPPRIANMLRRLFLV